MGAGERVIPELLGAKLAHIRWALGWSQGDMAVCLGMDATTGRAYVSGIERGTREIRLDWLLVYSELSGYSVNALLDDRLALDAVPSPHPHHPGFAKRKKASTAPPMRRIARRRRP